VERAVESTLKVLVITYCVEPKAGLFTIWAESLKDFSPEEILNGCRAVVDTFIPTMAAPFPTPAHLRQAILEPHAEAAWQLVMHVVRKGIWSPDYGYRYRKPTDPYIPDDWKPHIDAAGGLRHLYHADDEKRMWVKKDFVKSFLRAGKTVPAKQNPPPQPTRVEFPPDPPPLTPEQKAAKDEWCRRYNEAQAAGPAAMKRFLEENAKRVAEIRQKEAERQKPQQKPEVSPELRAEMRRKIRIATGTATGEDLKADREEQEAAAKANGNVA
jgi:hypothetical protein